MSYTKKLVSNLFAYLIVIFIVIAIKICDYQQRC